VEATQQAEDGWVDEIKRTARLGERFFAECTPGYYNNEGKPQDGGGFFTDNYGAGSEVFFQILRDWRAKGDLAGLELR
jgi:cyclohexanone monooxygenase